MKRILTTVVALAGIVTFAMAQSPDETARRIEALEATVQQHQAKIDQMSTQLDAVTAQNLALKKSLNLQPTVAKVTANNVEYRILEAYANPVDRQLTIVMMVENKGDGRTQLFGMNTPGAIDENGIHYGDGYTSFKVAGDGKKAAWTSHFPIDTPMQTILTFRNFNKDSQYIKRLSFPMDHGDNLVFMNLPVKWEIPD